MRTALLLLLTATAANGSPLAVIPRLDPDGLPLPTGATRRLGSGLFRVGHSQATAFSPDVAVMYYGASVPLFTDKRFGLTAWDTATGKALWSALPDFNTSAITPAADSNRLWVLGTGWDKADNRRRLMLVQVRASDGRELARHTTPLRDDYPQNCALTPTGRVAVRTQKQLMVLDGGIAEPVFSRTLTEEYQPRTFVLSQDGKRLLTAEQFVENNASMMRLTGYDLPGGRKVWSSTVPGDGIITAHPDGKRAWGVVDVDGVPAEFRLWSLDDGTAGQVGRLDRYGPDRVITPLEFPPGGKTALGFFDGGVAEFHLPHWTLKRKLPDLAGRWPKLTPDGKTLAALTDGTLGLFDLETGKRIAGREEGGPLTANLRFHSGKLLATRYHNAATFDLTTGRETARPAPPQAKYWAESDDGRVRVWRTSKRLRAGRDGRTVDLADSEEYGDSGALTVTPKGEYALARTDGYRTRVWDTSTGKKVHDLTPPEQGGGVFSMYPDNLRFAPGGQFVAVHDFNTHTPDMKSSTWHVSIWDLTDGTRVRQLTGAGMCAGGNWQWSADGKSLLMVGLSNPVKKERFGPGFLAVCDTTGEREPRVLIIGAQVEAVTADGRFFAKRSRNAVEFWDIDGRALRHTLRLPAGHTRLMTFTPDGKQFVTDGDAGTLLWPLPDLRRPPVAPPPRLIR